MIDNVPHLARRDVEEEEPTSVRTAATKSAGEYPGIYDGHVDKNILNQAENFNSSQDLFSPDDPLVDVLSGKGGEDRESIINYLMSNYHFDEATASEMYNDIEEFKKQANFGFLQKIAAEGTLNLENSDDTINQIDALNWEEDDPIVDTLTGQAGQSVEEIIPYLAKKYNLDEIQAQEIYNDVAPFISKHGFISKDQIKKLAEEFNVDIGDTNSIMDKLTVSGVTEEYDPQIILDILGDILNCGIASSPESLADFIKEKYGIDDYNLAQVIYTTTVVE
jgi:hypothetical protein